MKKFLVFLLAVITSIIFAPVSLSPRVQAEANTIPVSLPMKKVALPRLFFRLEKEVKVTNYIPKKGALTSTGKLAKFGIVAVDPKSIPYGTIIYLPDFPGQKFIADDKIGKKGIKAGVKIDICRSWNFPLKKAKIFGGEKRQITIIKPLTN